MTQIASTFRYTLSAHEMRDAQFAPFLDFTTRDGYLEWVRSWKDAYQAITAECRTAKGLRKSPEDGTRAEAQSARERCRVIARNLIDLRHRAKVAAAAQRAADRLVAA